MSFNLATILRESALAEPDKPMLRLGPLTLTYGQVDVLSGQVAAPTGHVEDQAVDPRGLRPVVEDRGGQPAQSPLYRCSRHGSPWLW